MYTGPAAAWPDPNEILRRSEPRDWSQSFSPFIVEDLGIPPSWDPCDELAPGATCVVYLTFQTDQAGTFAGWLWINDTYRVKLRALAT
jgi:hypothetical protein